MAVTTSMLGKRKLSSRSEAQHRAGSQQREKETRSSSNSGSESEETHQSDSDDVDDIFRRHFEAHFAPLEGVVKTGKQLQIEKQEEYAESNSDWEGLSEDESGLGNRAAPIEIVEFKEVQRTEDENFRAEKRAFMKSQPPSLVASHSGRTDGTKGRDQEDDKSEILNLKNDLELQRLIQESHLLNQSNARNSHNQRQKILDVRLQALGSKKSVLGQQNGRMPMAIRMGIAAKTNQREEKRRREAKENGVILERAATQKTKANGHKMRDAGVSDPAVGKFRGGATLQLSRRDIAEIRGNKLKLSTSRTGDYSSKKKMKAGKRR